MTTLAPALPDLTALRNAYRQDKAALLARMNETQHHRGPDEGDIYTEPGVGFGHRRLSVIDLATGRPQRVPPEVAAPFMQ